MGNSRTFSLMNNVTIEMVGEHLVTWFQNTKNMISEGGKAQGGGYFIQAKDQEDGWKKISGMTKALQIQIIKADSSIVVNCDFGKWSDKVGSGALGMFVFAPLAVTAGIGAYKQSKLPNEVFDEIEKFIMSGGKTAVVSMGSRLNDNETECPSCGAKNPKNQKFCKECGGKLGINCPTCGALLTTGTKFCPECGSSTIIENKCVSCGQALPVGQKFCPNCGAKQVNSCPNCGAELALDKKFCSECGTSLVGKKICPNCKAEIEPNKQFCGECGTKI